MPSGRAPESAAFGGRRRSWRRASAGRAAGRAASTATAPAGSGPPRTIQRLCHAASARTNASSDSAQSRSGAVALAMPVSKSKEGHWTASYCGDCRSSDRALVSPPVALTLHVFARILTEIGRADDEDLEALRPGLVASPRTGWDAHRVPFLEPDDLVVELHPPAPTHDHVYLLLLLVRVAVRKAIVGRDALVAQAGLLEFKRLACVAKLQVRRAGEVGPDVLQVLLEVPERVRHGRSSTRRNRRRRSRRTRSSTDRCLGSAGRTAVDCRGTRKARPRLTKQTAGWPADTWDPFVASSCQSWSCSTGA